VSTLKAICPSARLVLDLGCGTGSLAMEILTAMPEVHVVGLDLDPSMLLLARRRLKAFGPRFVAMQVDLRDSSWPARLAAPADAAVSATALHWLSASELETLYAMVAGALRAGGLFLNGDHVAAECSSVQQAWQGQEEAAGHEDRVDKADTWEGFWTAYGKALGVDLRAMQKELFGPWRGVEEGMSLSWNFATLCRAGFAWADCFWRWGANAVYGGQTARRQA
jgi:SAM-dependent methyltransferase